MAILAKFEKQPADVQDFDVDYSEWLTGLSDTILSGSATAEAGITLDKHEIVSGAVKVWLSGGTNGIAYKITTTVITVGGRTKQAEIIVKVKEY